jgi:RimJ/RimL family protein N-acetyltransferase
VRGTRSSSPKLKAIEASGLGLWLRNIDLGRASVGYWVAPSARGRRAAGHALCAVRDWAFATLHIPRLELYVEPWNTASIRTAEAAGFRREGLLRSWETVGDERRDMLMFSSIEGAALPEPS